jgi:hypothetical protein|tara:strand:+ start:768 stop:953 length:186 start_codon:yes stop_codon:yes gene_type:complete
VGELIDFGQAREDREEAELLELQLRVEAALCGIGPVTSGPMWLDPVTGDLVLLVEIDLPNI